MENEITLTALKQLLENKEKVILLDVRSDTEYNESHIPDALHVPVEQIEAGLYTPDPGAIIVTACRNGGGRSRRSAAYIQAHHANETYFLEGGTFGYLADTALQ